MLGGRGERGRGGPRVQRWRFHAFYVIQIQLGNQREVKTDLLAPLRQLFHILPSRLHVFVFNVAQPSAKNWKPVSISHLCAPLTTLFSNRPDRKSTRLNSSHIPL